MLTRRDVLVGSAATVAALSMPAALPAAAATTPPLVADMFYTPDEPWGAFVRAHVPKEQFEQAILRMIDSNSDYRMDGLTGFAMDILDVPECQRVDLMPGMYCTFVNGNHLLLHKTIWTTHDMEEADREADRLYAAIHDPGQGVLK